MRSDDYIVGILERLKALEVTIKNYEEIEETSEEAKSIASSAREEVRELANRIEEEQNKLQEEETKVIESGKWLKRTLIAAIISLIFVLIGNIAFTIIKNKLGW